MATRRLRTRKPHAVAKDATRTTDEVVLKSYDFLLFALKSALTINGGAAIALIALLNTVAKDHHDILINFDTAVLWALVAFWSGVFLAVWSGIFAYIHLNVQPIHWWWSVSGWLYLANLGASVIAFLVGTTQTLSAIIELIENIGS